jgi:multidrug efflux pump
MIFASFLGIFAIPPLHVIFQQMREKLRPGAHPPEAERTSEAETPPAVHAPAE